MAETLKKRPSGMDSPLVPKVMKYAGRMHVAVYRRTGGRIGARWRIGSALRRPVPICLLEHVGRRSGTTYTIPLLYLRDGPDVVIVASQGGLPRHPQWYRNLMATPETRIQIGSEVREVRARTADAQERRRLWPQLVDLYADFDSYQSWTEREIPVVICSPR